MNDQIRNLLIATKCYELRDQTRQGTSPGGKQAGKLDIQILKDNFPFSIVEGLKLTGFDSTYISKHIDKIYKNYDTLGYTCNFIISYVKIKNFTGFWKKYLQYVKSYNYPFELVNFKIVPDKQYSEIKSALAVLNRNGNFTKLYHIAIHIT